MEAIKDGCPACDPLVLDPAALCEAGEGEGGARSRGWGPLGPEGVLALRASAMDMGELKKTLPNVGVGMLPPASVSPLIEFNGGVCAPSTRTGTSPIRVRGRPAFSGSPPGSPFETEAVDEKLPPRLALSSADGNSILPAAYAFRVIVESLMPIGRAGEGLFAKERIKSAASLSEATERLNADLREGVIARPVSGPLGVVMVWERTGTGPNRAALRANCCGCEWAEPPSEAVDMDDRGDAATPGRDMSMSVSAVAACISCRLFSLSKLDWEDPARCPRTSFFFPFPFPDLRGVLLAAAAAFLGGIEGVAKAGGALLCTVLARLCGGGPRIAANKDSVALLVLAPGLM